MIEWWQLCVFQDALKLICGCASQSRKVWKKQSFYVELKNEWYVHSLDDLVVLG